MDFYFTGMYRIASLVFIICFGFGAGAFGQSGKDIQRIRKEALEAFKPRFTVFYRTSNPKMSLRPSKYVDGYGIPTWMSTQGDENLRDGGRSASHYGDGFDSRILEAKMDKRTANSYLSAKGVDVKGKVRTEDGTVYWTFPEHELFRLEAKVSENEDGTLGLRFKLHPKKDGYYSVAYTGAPSYALKAVDEIWQPMIWSEKRFPNGPHMTLAFRAPLPTTLVERKGITYGVLAHPDEFPFDPLPTVSNSRFGIAVRNAEGKAQAQLFAPVMGGTGSKMAKGEDFEFSVVLAALPGDLTEAYESLARNHYGFRDYRRNSISSLNKTLDRMVNYANSSFSQFVDSLKGFGYSTDVPGAVKNVSSLNALEMAMVQDNPDMFWEKAYPMVEYMLSREKFLFSLDPKQKNQHPSRRLLGPVAPVSELVALHDIFGGENPFLIQMAEENFLKTRVKNLDVAEREDNWINALFLYKSTKDEKYLTKAKSGADQYLRNRVERKQTDFNDEYGKSFFFWIDFTNRWIELVELYELTGEERYLEAAREGARRYALMCWMAPKIPEGDILVNKGGKAPAYWYLKSKGHEQMSVPETNVPAWRMSEIGLTSESSGTCSGHRAVFMANFAPWMLRLGKYCNDDFLMEIAKAAVIGRYRNFPGYHINTARTNAYESADYPLRAHKKLSVNSFHYNHILPMASMLLDYLVTDVWARSNGEISFPSTYIEGYAYMKNKFYGHEEGRFYSEKGVRLWMPEGLLEIDNVELNYIAGRKEGKLFLAFSNQSPEDVKTTVRINPVLVRHLEKSGYTVYTDNKLTQEKKSLGRAGFTVNVKAKGLTAIVIEGVDFKSELQNKLSQETNLTADNTEYKSLEFGGAKAMLFKLGGFAPRAYIYLSDDDSQYSSVNLHYKKPNGKTVTIKDAIYPFEFTVELDTESPVPEFWFSATDKAGKRDVSKKFSFGGVVN
ncbi:hypothetical protein FUAX_44370 (plasmid) [Fulvitalea axinellae]|uniref:Alpha-1,2-mannosidase n=1 Tax=Fulvitalea axinellae TaxID=1182444 RepID=A0AAU9CRJ7_9BACT|nr:hypothetical protein FUAX_44370 [Fulvitalea axinellae]